MDQFRFGVIGLSAAEDSLVATLFRLYRVDPTFCWALVSAPPYDALLVDATCDRGQFAHLLGAGSKVMRLGAVNSEAPGEFSRPIRSDRLVRWLTTCQLQGGHLSPQEPNAAHALPLEQAPPLQQHPRPSSIAAGTLPSPSSDLPAGARIKLRRWPGRTLLAGDLHRIRMATLLSRRALSVDDLRAATGLPLTACGVFTQSLYQAGLLDLSPAAEARPSPAEMPPAATGNAPPAPTTRGIGGSLLRSIRQRLGL